MNIRFSRLATGILAIAAIVLMSGRGWAVYYGLDPSPDEWGLKYDVEVKAAAGDTLTVAFTLADEGRLKPIYSIEVIALSKQTDGRGGHTYDVKAPIKLKATDDGKRAGQVQIRKDLIDRAKIRILTLTIDGKRQASGSFYDIPLKKYLGHADGAASIQAPPSIATRPAAKVTK